MSAWPCSEPGCRFVARSKSGARSHARAHRRAGGRGHRCAECHAQHTSARSLHTHWLLKHAPTEPVRRLTLEEMREMTGTAPNEREPISCRSHQWGVSIYG